MLKIMEGRKRRGGRIKSSRRKGKKERNYYNL